jgi:SAP domain
MSSWRCVRCRTTYAVGLEACPQCGDTTYSEGGIVVAKASPEGAATVYVGEGVQVPDDLPEGVRLVGPGAPVAEPEPEPEEAEAEVVPDPGQPGPATTPGPDSTPPPDSEGSSDLGDDDDGPPDYGAYRIVDLRDLCRERGLSPVGAKADLVARLAAYDAEHANAAAEIQSATDQAQA